MISFSLAGTYRWTFAAAGSAAYQKMLHEFIVLTGTVLR